MICARIRGAAPGAGRAPGAGFGPAPLGPGAARGLAVIAALFGASLLLAAGGCGGGGTARPSTSGGSGRVSVTVKWPERSRLIPLACNSIRIQSTRGTTVLGNTVVNRPGSGGTSVAGFENLPVGLVTVKATAYPQAGAAGTAQATGSVNVTVASGQTANAAVILESTISRLEVAPASPSLVEGQSTSLTVRARDVASSLVLVAASAYQWTSENQAVAKVTSAGVLSAVAPGATTITVRDTESSEFITVPVRITAALTINPTAAGLLIGTAQQFSVVVAGLPSAGVTWSVQEAGGGSISLAGLYTAPNAAGVYHVVATSQADPTKTATAPVTVVEVPTVTIGPTAATVSVRETVQFAAAVYGMSNAVVTWRVTEASGGSVSGTGLYTAPATPGTYHVVVASQAFPDRTATATVNVQAGSISGTIQ